MGQRAQFRPCLDTPRGLRGTTAITSQIKPVMVLPLFHRKNTHDYTYVISQKSHKYIGYEAGGHARENIAPLEVNCVVYGKSILKKRSGLATT